MKPLYPPLPIPSSLTPTPTLVAQCLTALTQHGYICDLVQAEAMKPGGGGMMVKWTSLAYEYAQEICRLCERKEAP
jgi:hypothetical protein